MMVGAFLFFMKGEKLLIFEIIVGLMAFMGILEYLKDLNEQIQKRKIQVAEYESQKRRLKLSVSLSDEDIEKLDKLYRTGRGKLTFNINEEQEERLFNAIDEVRKKKVDPMSKEFNEKLRK